MAKKIDPPYRLDPLKNIVGVGWGGSIVVLIFEWTVSGATTETPSVASWNAVFTGDTDGGLSGESLLDELGPRVNPPGPPKTTPAPESVPGNNNFWCYPRENSSDTHTDTVTFHIVDRGRYGIFTSAGTITAFEDPIFGTKVPFIIDSTLTGMSVSDGLDVYGTKDSPSTQAALQAQINAIAFNEFEPDPPVVQPYLLAELSGHDETTVRTTLTREGRTITFLNPGRIAAKDATVKEAKQIKLVVLISPASSRTFEEWTIACASFLGGVASKFNVLDHPPFVEPDPSKAPVDFKVLEGERAPEVAAPAVEVTITINLETYKITMTSRNL